MAAPPDPLPEPIVRSPLTLAAGVQNLVDHLTIRKLAPASMKAYRADLAAISARLPDHDGAWTVDELTGPVLRAAFAAFAAKHAPASVARARSTWTALFDLLVADAHLDGSPMAAVPRTRQPPRAPKPLLGWDKDTVERLCESVLAGERVGRSVWPELDRVVIALLLGTGLRSAELLAVNLGSFETVKGDATVRVVGKGAKPRTVPVPDPLPQLIDVYLASRLERFPTWKRRLSHALLVAPPRETTHPNTRRAGGKRLTAAQLDYLLRQVLVAAGLGSRKPKGANAHAYRHTFGTLLAAEGTPVADLRGLMGHASLATTQGYVDSVGRDRQAAAAANPALRHLRARDGGGR